MRVRTIGAVVTSVLILATLGVRLVESRAQASEADHILSHMVEPHPEDTVAALRFKRATDPADSTASSSDVAVYFPGAGVVCRLDPDSETGLVVAAYHAERPAELGPAPARGEASAAAPGVEAIEVPLALYVRICTLARITGEVAEYAETVRSELDGARLFERSE